MKKLLIKTEVDVNDQLNKTERKIIIHYSRCFLEQK